MPTVGNSVIESVTHDVDEAILLADRVIVLTDGVISLDVDVTVPKPRARDTHEFNALRKRLLSELGVSEDKEPSDAI